MVELLRKEIVNQVILIPAGQPRLREAAPSADGQSRLEMCKLAISDLPAEIKDRVTVSDTEIRRSGPSYAIDTVTEFQREGQELYWIIGSDAYANIDKWHESAKLQEEISFIVIDRPGSQGADGENLDIDALDISATSIRSDAQVNGVSPSVRKYIIERKLYASK